MSNQASTPPTISTEPTASTSSPFLQPPGLAYSTTHPDPTTVSLTSSVNEQKDGDVTVDCRALMRTPSPTPSEHEILKTKLRTCGINFRKYVSWSYLKHPRNVMSLSITILVLAGLITFVALEGKIVDKITPAANWLRETPGAWTIPLALMIVLSFPPLIGHEIVAILCGVVWGLWIGFAIVAVGTFAGEIFEFYLYRYWCRGRGKKIEDKNLRYALISEVVRDGGHTIAIMARYSAIPGHITTAIFATAGMSVWTYLLSAFLSLPKQLASVYLGVQQHGGPAVDSNGEEVPLDSATTGLKYGVLGLTIFISILALWYVNYRIEKIKVEVIYARRKDRQAKMVSKMESSNSLNSVASRPAPDDPEAGSASQPALEMRERVQEIPIVTIVPK